VKKKNLQLLLWVQYEDEDGDKVVLASDDDLAAAGGPREAGRMEGTHAQLSEFPALPFGFSRCVWSLTVCAEFCRA